MGEADRRQQIMKAALQVFSEQGFHRASIKQIAQAAGIKSSALIYHYFEDKNALLRAVVHELSPLKDFPMLDEQAAVPIMNVPPEVLLPRITSTVLALTENRDMMRLLRLYVSDAAHTPEVADAVSDLQATAIRLLERYFEHQVSLGTLKPHNAASSARALVGLVMVYVMGSEIFIGMGTGQPGREQYGADIVELFLKGLANDE